MADFFANNGSDLVLKTWEHLYISIIALSLGVIVAVPLGIILTRFKRLSSFVIGLATSLQTVPSLAL